MLNGKCFASRERINLEHLHHIITHGTSATDLHRFKAEQVAYYSNKDLEKIFVFFVWILKFNLNRFSFFCDHTEHINGKETMIGYEFFVFI